MISKPLPAIVVHADWSAHVNKRWQAMAIRQGNDRYCVYPPERVGALPNFFNSLLARATPSGVFVGFDFPIGLPYHYTQRVGARDFLKLLPELGRGQWENFFQVADCPAEISLYRPFFPKTVGKKGAYSRQQLLDGLGIERYSDLLRLCDQKTPHRRAANALFWTLGGQQVGKAAIVGWRDLLIPAIRSELDMVIWPFSGYLETLFAPGRIVVAETYPGEVYGHLGIRFPASQVGRRSGKRVQADRAVNAVGLMDWARASEVILDYRLRILIEEGFGASPQGEDAFDATVGLLGMLNILLGGRPAGEPENQRVRCIEGCILGQTE